MKYKLTRYETVEYFNDNRPWRVGDVARLNLINADPRNVKMVMNWLNKKEKAA